MDRGHRKSDQEDKMMRKISIAAIAVVMMVVGLTSPAYAGKKLVLDVEPDLSAFSFVAGDNGGGQFFIPGVIFEPGTDNEVGTFLCWGWMSEGGPVLVNQEFDIDGCGKIQTQGVEDEGQRAVTGGTGRFRNVRGQVKESVFDPVEPFLNFTVTFKLIGGNCNLGLGD